MRIISGIYKGKRLTAPKNLPVRPTTDFAKEGLFNMLNSRIDFEGISVLDLCAGTGNISFEFASREASSVLSIDQDRGCINFIRKTAEELHFEQISVIRSDIFVAVKKPLGSFDIIFADPPFGIKGSKELPDEIFNGNLLRPNGIFIMEHPKDIVYESHPRLILTRKFGNVHFSLFQH